MFKSRRIRHFSHRRSFAGASAFEEVRDWIRSLEESFGSFLLLAQQSQDVPAVSEQIGTGWEQRVVKIHRRGFIAVTETYERHRASRPAQNRGYIASCVIYKWWL